MDYVQDLKGILSTVEKVRTPLVEKADILRQNIMRDSQMEWLKGESPRCKREQAMAQDCSALRKVRDAIETIVDNRHLLDEIFACFAKGDINEFFKKYEQIG